MAEYIEVETLLEFVKQNTPNIDGETTMECVERAIKEAPTADVVEVKHGEWIYNIKYYSCSICAGKRFNLLLGLDAEFCPHCGAKMDGGNAE